MAAANLLPERYQITTEILLNEAELALLALAKSLTEDHMNAIDAVIPDVNTTYRSIRALRKELAISADGAVALDRKTDRLRATLRFLGKWAEDGE